MNYIKHLNTFFSLIKTDDRLSSSHITLYFALFHYWNFNRFNNPFSIYRENIMQLSKLSKNTYHKCLKELHEAKYIYYHSSPSKFQAVRISIIRLHKEEEPESPYKQLDLFASRKIETDSVPNLIPTSPNIKTDTVANLRHSYKPNILKQRETLPQNFFNDDKKEIKKIAPPHVSNPGHEVVVTLSEVEGHFLDNNYPRDEGIKFYNHYKSLHWKLQGKTPILDWKPLVEKWMQNAKKWEMSSAGGGGTANSRDGGGQGKDIQFLYDSFLENKNIFHQITTDHFTQLKLQLTNEIVQQAWQQRIQQISGTNQHSLNELWQAYLTGDPENELVKKDQPNFISLAKKLAVINYFHHCKQRNIQHLSLPP